MLHFVSFSQLPGEVGLSLFLIFWMRTPRNKKLMSSRAGLSTQVYLIPITTRCFLNDVYNCITILYEEYIELHNYKHAILQRCS